jgi:hypothetical protein
MDLLGNPAAINLRTSCSRAVSMPSDVVSMASAL